jgi:hypothetical protein
MSIVSVLVLRAYFSFIPTPKGFKILRVWRVYKPLKYTSITFLFKKGLM